MYKNAEENFKNRTFYAHDFEEYKKVCSEREGFAKIMWCGNRDCEDKIKEETGITSRCIPFEGDNKDGKCCVCGKDAEHLVYWGKQY